MATNDFKALAIGGGANVISQAEFAALATLLANGFTGGVVPSNVWNKVARQASVLSSVLAQYIVDAGLDALDDGDTATLLSHLKTAISSQIDQRFSGKDPKESARVASTANVASLSGLPVIDGVTLVAGDRVLLKNQTSPADNGIYVAAAGAWSRAADAVTGTLSAGATVPVTEGTVGGDTLWLLTTNDPITVGTTALVFVALGGISQATADLRYAALAGLSSQAFNVLAATASAHAVNLGQFTGSNQSFLTNGFQKLPGGTILQWGVATGSASPPATVTFPAAFPNAVRSVQTTAIFGGQPAFAQVEGAPTLSSFTTRITQSPTTNLTQGIFWFAIGN